MTSGPNYLCMWFHASPSPRFPPNEATPWVDPLPLLGCSWVKAFLYVLGLTRLQTAGRRRRRRFGAGGADDAAGAGGADDADGGAGGV